MRRVLTTIALGLVLAAPAIPASAEDQVPIDRQWGGSNVQTPPPITGPTNEVRIEGRIQNGSGRRDSVAYTTPAVAVTFDADPVFGCEPRPDGPATRAGVSGPTVGGGVSSGWKTHSYWADAPFTPTTNGAYKVFVCINDEHVLDTDVVVRLPAPTVTNLVATSAGHDVTLAWDDMRPGAPDVSGYRIDRSVDGGTFEALDVVGADAQTFTDTTLPADGGEASYQVSAQRPLVADAAPSNAATATFEPGPPTTSGDGGGDGTTPGGGSGGTATGGTDGGGTGGTGGGTAGGSGSGGSGGGHPTINRGPTIRIPRVGTPTRNFFPALLAPPAMDAYSDQLPYDAEAAEAIEDELASEPLEELPGRGLAIPIATGLVLGVWALHLRFLARASRPANEDAIDIIDILQ